MATSYKQPVRNDPHRVGQIILDEFLDTNVAGMDIMMVRANDICGHIIYYCYTLTPTHDLCFIENILWQNLGNISCLPDIQGWLLPSPPLTPHKVNVNKIT